MRGVTELIDRRHAFEAVTAIDELGHESTRSPETEETVPNL